MLRENNGVGNDRMAKEAAARENLPPHFTKEQIEAKLAEVNADQRSSTDVLSCSKINSNKKKTS